MTYEEALIDLQSIYKGHGGLYTDDSPAWKLAFDALEKQIPKKIIKEEYMYGFTAKCINRHNIPTVCRDGEMPYCPFCGQKLNWRDEE